MNGQVFMGGSDELLQFKTNSLNLHPNFLSREKILPLWFIPGNDVLNQGKFQGGHQRQPHVQCMAV